MIAHGDFETRGTVDLQVAGLDNYARHPDTSPWCFSWCIGDSPVGVWTPGEPFPKELRTHIEGGGTFVAHNVAFELAIWNLICVPRYGWPVLRPEQCECTCAMAHAMGLPGSLEKAAPAAGIEMRKDAAGKRLMLQMCRPRQVLPDGTIIWWDEPDKLARLIEYCIQDTAVERQLHGRLVPLSALEREVFLLDYVINNRGVRVDLESIQIAERVVQTEQDRLNLRIREVTGNMVGFTTEVAQLTKWIRNQGVEIPGVAKAAVLDALSDDTLPEHVREALEIRQEAGRSSTAKLGKMRELASADGRVRNTKQYHGASTGRWAGRGMQTDNFPRPTFSQEEIDAAFPHLGNASYLDNFIGKPVDVIVSCLRGMIVPDIGKDFLVGDFANIEGRMLAWLAGESWKLQAFREFDAGIGPDIYKLTYAKSFGVPISSVTKDLRQIGKVEELALGFGGGVGAFQTMAKGYNVVMDDERAAEIKHGWRDAHPEIVQYWYDVEAAAINAVLNPGVFAAGPKGREVKYRKSGSFLWCRLPSGRVLCYPYPKIMSVTTPWGAQKDALTYFTVISPTAMKAAKIIRDPNALGTWQRISTYGGSLVENITQASARDVLAEAMLRLDPQFPIVMHVHDEAVAETDEDAPEVALPDFAAILSKVPTWCKELPIAVECWRGKRYRK